MRSKSHHLFRQLREYRFLNIFLYFILGAVIFAALYSNIKPETLDVELFSLSDQTIYAPITVEDKIETERKQQEAYDSVEDQYVLRREITDKQVDLVSSIFDTIIEVNEESNSAEKGKNKTLPIEEAKLKSLQKKLTSSINERIPENVFETLLAAKNDELKMAKDAVVTAVNNIMSKEIPIVQLTEAKNQVHEELQYAPLRQDILKSATELGKFAITPNYVFDLEATEIKRQQAVDNVKEVQIKQGQIIVEEDELINREIYRKLGLVGLLDNEKSYKPFIGAGLLILLIVAAIIYYFEKLEKQALKKNNYLLLYCLIFSITILLLKIVSLFQKIDYTYIGYVVPIAMGPMLIKLLINERLAILTSMILAVTGSIIFNEGVTGTFNFQIGIYYLFGCLGGILFLGEQNLRSKILQAGLFVALINLIIINAVMLITNGTYSNLETGSYFIMASVSGLVSSVLTIGFMPFFETGFGILSAMKLIEYSSPNHPLLRKILTETPGTYHHSVMVANLSESACEAIGANGLLARVGAYYHDIGKTKRPRYFIENQMNIENPHNKLSAQLSKNIIIAHVTDGVEILRKHKMPKEFIDIAEQHHGTTLLKYFYHKAKETNDAIYEDEFRYPGPKPQTKEIAIISIADSVEAAVRSMSNPTPEKIEKLVRSIIADRLQDNQLNECDITLKELDIIAKSFCETLKGIFHSRIEYPELNKKQKEKKS
ncbi:HD family phosphohydrolase [Metabacillus fastidiosus]|uniref:HD family phosphohydrolase n=2 Tax=Metabacillus fastidiosus TaxID=1458 RepID=A0ABU6NV11_9BACI|nr:HD family phosphohydrolase [Metabacillus fastidiosus]MED4400977.1 HD family phosphohydrolase [Metabacillus fastidiosus]MED4463903.1 HD family phosphohydrolase [Metabacillus fastidiosus]